MGHPQPPTPIQVDNSTACGIANNNIRIQGSKAIDMRFYWVRDRVDQNQFKVYWRPGKTNLADYVTKHHTSTHHQLMCPIYLHQAQYLKTLQDLQQSHTPLHCEGVLIPRYPRDNSPAPLEPGGQEGQLACTARQPFGNPIATISNTQQAKIINSLII